MNIWTEKQSEFSLIKSKWRVKTGEKSKFTNHKLRGELLFLPSPPLSFFLLFFLSWGLLITLLLKWSQSGQRQKSWWLIFHVLSKCWDVCPENGRRFLPLLEGDLNSHLLGLGDCHQAGCWDTAVLLTHSAEAVMDWWRWSTKGMWVFFSWFFFLFFLSFFFCRPWLGWFLEERWVGSLRYRFQFPVFMSIMRNINTCGSWEKNLQLLFSMNVTHLSDVWLKEHLF